MKRIVFVVSFLLLLTALATASASGTLTVGSGGDYNSIQDAINYISKQSDKDGWTIDVKVGTYSRFNVPGNVTNLTVKSTAGSTISVLDGSPSPTGRNDDSGGINFQQARGLTLDGLTFQSGGQKKNWIYAAITNFGNSGGGNNITVKNCKFKGTMGNGILISSGVTDFTIENCTFDSSVDTAINVMNDGTAVGSVTIKGNTFDKNSFALHGYWGKAGGQSLNFTGNTVTGVGEGSGNRRCKIVIQDDGNKGSVKPNISGNTFENGLIGLVNVKDDGVTASDVLGKNTINAGTFGVDAVEPGSIDFYSSYVVNQGDYRYGRWVITGLNNTNWSEEQKALINDAIEQANRDQSDTVSISSLPDGSLIRTFTYFKDAIYWVPYTNGKLTVTKKTEGSLSGRFDIAVTLSGNGIPSGVQRYGDTNFTDGKAELTLSPGDSVTFEGIPAGTSFEVQETAGDYTTSYETASGRISENKESHTVIINSPKTTPTPVPAPTPTPPSQDDIDKLPKTGDQTPVALAFMALILSGSALLLINRRKK